jgi:hypothetical protein
VQTLSATLLPLEVSELDIKEVVDQYNALRERCYKLMRDNPEEVLGDQYWLRYAISEGDINMECNGTYIACYGHTYSMQTMSTEYFNFDIPLSEVENPQVAVEARA